MADKGIDWVFIPKRAPNYGGFYERLIGMTKNCLKKVIGHALVTKDELSTITCEIEAILNDRPLTHTSTNIADAQPLTPAHLLHGRLLTPLPQPIVDIDQISDLDFVPVSRTELTKRTEYLARLYQRFWQRWHKEYVLSLRERHRQNMNKNTENHIKIGDIVLVHNDNKKRLLWNLAVVEKLNFDNDGL
ncbi:uncharacterized protein LOC100368009, partial [Saccoglossus kowalevskii]|uniref:Uncharacterized protein LOC100368009 n=1 Tax=Saccoglossus kowalevskii TaxID=10224 RepID=A0ABM0H0X5_SACKO